MKFVKYICFALPNMFYGDFGSLFTEKYDLDRRLRKIERLTHCFIWKSLYSMNICSGEGLYIVVEVFFSAKGNHKICLKLLRQLFKDMKEYADCREFWFPYFLRFEKLTTETYDPMYIQFKNIFLTFLKDILSLMSEENILQNFKQIFRLHGGHRPKKELLDSINDNLNVSSEPISNKKISPVEKVCKKFYYNHDLLKQFLNNLININLHDLDQIWFKIQDLMNECRNVDEDFNQAFTECSFRSKQINFMNFEEFWNKKKHLYKLLSSFKTSSLILICKDFHLSQRNIISEILILIRMALTDCKNYSEPEKDIVKPLKNTILNYSETARKLEEGALNILINYCSKYPAELLHEIHSILYYICERLEKEQYQDGPTISYAVPTNQEHKINHDKIEDKLRLETPSKNKNKKKTKTINGELDETSISISKSSDLSKKSEKKNNNKKKIIISIISASSEKRNSGVEAGAKVPKTGPKRRSQNRERESSVSESESELRKSSDGKSKGKSPGSKAKRSQNIERGGSVSESESELRKSSDGKSKGKSPGSKAKRSQNRERGSSVSESESELRKSSDGKSKGKSPGSKAKRSQNRERGSSVSESENELRKSSDGKRKLIISGKGKNSLESLGSVGKFFDEGKGKTDTRNKNKKETPKSSKNLYDSEEETSPQANSDQELNESDAMNLPEKNKRKLSKESKITNDIDSKIISNGDDNADESNDLIHELNVINTKNVDEESSKNILIIDKNHSIEEAEFGKAESDHRRSIQNPCPISCYENYAPKLLMVCRNTGSQTYVKPVKRHDNLPTSRSVDSYRAISSKLTDNSQEQDGYKTSFGNIKNQAESLFEEQDPKNVTKSGLSKNDLENESKTFNIGDEKENLIERKECKNRKLQTTFGLPKFIRKTNINRKLFEYQINQCNETSFSFNNNQNKIDEVKERKRKERIAKVTENSKQIREKNSQKQHLKSDNCNGPLIHIISRGDFISRKCEIDETVDDQFSDEKEKCIIDESIPSQTEISNTKKLFQTQSIHWSIYRKRFIRIKNELLLQKLIENKSPRQIRRGEKMFINKEHHSNIIKKKQIIENAFEA